MIFPDPARLTPERTMERADGRGDVFLAHQGDDILAWGDETSKEGQAFDVLCVHGVGKHDEDLSWQFAWAHAILSGILNWRPDAMIRCRFLMYDQAFRDHPTDPILVAKALAELVRSGIVHGIGDFISGLFGRRGKSLSSVSDKVRWTAGMVAQWTADGDLRQVLRSRVNDALVQGDFNADIIAAHSLGSLVCYDTFLRAEPEALNSRYFVAFGSQIGNPFVRSTFGGMIREIPCKQWFHLFNQHDDIFTARIHRVKGDFLEVDTPFDLPGFGDHDAPVYLAHSKTIEFVWSAIASDRTLTAATRAPGENSFQKFDSAFKAVLRVAEKNQPPRRRALLVGINNYPDEDMRLEGCVNDTFQVSAVLQELGFQPEDIRLVLDERATARGIRERLEWLLDGAEDGAQRIFYYSGHGAQLESYGLGDTVDRRDECLVPYDFDWSLGTAIVDDDLFGLYSQLDFTTSLTFVLDCCHSGGLNRDGLSKVRGLNPPDDVRHRGLKWNEKDQMWVERKLPVVNENFVNLSDLSKKFTSTKARTERAQRIRQEYMGANHDKHRLGRGITTRQCSGESFSALKKELGHGGPFQPLILHACQESEYAWEYRHGSVAYGAFTYAMSLVIRDWKLDAPAKPTFERLVAATGTKLKRLGYKQAPGLFGPTAVKAQPVPWLSSEQA